MINKNVNNMTFANFVIDIIEDKYDIIFTNSITELEDNWSKLAIIFNTNCHENYITQDINYRTQTINDLVNVVSKKIDKAIIKSYLK